MQNLTETHTKTVSGGLDASQATYALVLATQGILGLSVQGACKVLQASPAGIAVAYGLIPTLNVVAYIGACEFGNWYYARDAKKS